MRARVFRRNRFTATQYWLLGGEDRGSGKLVQASPFLALVMLLVRGRITCMHVMRIWQGAK
jgi:hypothetical protein